MADREKIVIVGAGHVGSHGALALAAAAVTDEIVLVDKDEAKAWSQALDISDALSSLASSSRVRSGGWDDCADAAIVIIAIGEPRLPGQTRLDLLGRSVQMVQDLLGELRPRNLTGVVVTVTNPADIVADFVRRGLGLPRTRVFGTGTLLDTARLVRILAEAAGCHRSDVQAYALGEHGDSSVVPFSQVRLAGRTVGAFPSLDVASIEAATRRAGMEVIEGKGSTEFGIGQALAVLCRAILRDEGRVLPLSVLLEGEYGQRDVHCGVPCVVGRSGIEAVVELDLDADELTRLDQSCQVIRTHIHKAQALAPLGAR